MDLQCATSLTCFLNKKKFLESERMTIINQKIIFYDNNGNMVQLTQKENQLEISIKSIKKE